jgi:hypothetical protein
VATGSGAGIAEGGWGKPTSHSVSIGAIEGEAEGEDLDLSIADSEDEHSPVGEFLSCELPRIIIHFTPLNYSLYLLLLNAL